MKKSTSTNISSEQPPHQAKFLWFVLCLALTGLGVSVKLSSIHYHSYMTQNYDSVCNINEGINCVAVAESPYSVFLGVPVSRWSYFGYLLIAIFALWGLYHHARFAKLASALLVLFSVAILPLIAYVDGYLQETWMVTAILGLVTMILTLVIAFTPIPYPWPLGIVLLLVAAAVVVSSLLAYVSITIIQSVCLFCTALYIINLILIAALTVYAIRSQTPLHKAIVSNLSTLIDKPMVLGALFVVIAGATAAQPFSFTPYWQHRHEAGDSVGWSELPKLRSGVNQNGFHWIGATSPLVTIVEFSDYQCPFCRHAHKTTRRLAGKHPDTVRLIHRHLPLDRACNKDIHRSFHDRACEFARAAECAGEQDQFWQMNDALFSTQNEKNVDADDVDVTVLAENIGLDEARFDQCMARTPVPKAILKDMAASRALSVKGTPTFFIDGQPYAGSIPPRALESALKRAMQKK